MKLVHLLLRQHGHTLFMFTRLGIFRLQKGSRIHDLSKVDRCLTTCADLYPHRDVIKRLQDGDIAVWAAGYEDDGALRH